MKKLTKVLSLVLALALVLMSVNIVAVNAADKSTVTIKETTANHDFTAIRIFSGDVVGIGADKVLTNIEWDTKFPKDQLLTKLVTVEGESVQSVAGVALKEYISGISTSTSASQFAKMISAIGNDSRAASVLARIISELGNISSGTQTKFGSGSYDGSDYVYTAELDPGYYIIFDEFSGEPTDEDRQNAFILTVIEPNEEIKTKAADVFVEKDVATKQASYSVGEKVPFVVTVHLPDDVSTYNGGYTLKVTDYFDGFGLNDGTVGDDTHTNVLKSIKIYKANAGTPFEDAKKSTPIWEYGEYGANTHFSAKFEAASGDSHNSGEAHNDLVIEHSNEGEYVSADHWKDYDGKVLYFYYEAVLTDEAYSGDNSNSSLENGSNEVTVTYSNHAVSGGKGNTSTDVKVYTLEIDVAKYAADTTAADGSVTDTVDSATALDDAQFSIVKLDAAQSSVTPDPLFAKQTANANTKTGSSDPTNAINLKYAKFKGIGDGVYEITEVTAPTGYSKIAPFYIKISSEKDATGALSAVTVTKYNTYADCRSGISGETWETTIDGDGNTIVKTGTIVFNVLDAAGIHLPETGGMGTKIFYTLGGVLVVGAVILLVVKRRMRAE